MSIVTTVEELEAIYGQTNDASTVKVADRVTPLYRILIETSPFVICKLNQAARRLLAR